MLSDLSAKKHKNIWLAAAHSIWLRNKIMLAANENWIWHPWVRWHPDDCVIVLLEFTSCTRRILKPVLLETTNLRNYVREPIVTSAVVFGEAYELVFRYCSRQSNTRTSWVNRTPAPHRLLPDLFTVSMAAFICGDKAATSANDWWRHQGVLDRNAYMLEYGIHSDVTFSVYNQNRKFDHLVT